MKLTFYPRLALDGIRKNRRLYVPYLVTAAAMVMMYYIVSFLSVSPAIARLRGGNFLAGMLELGSWILALFSALFLLYSNSFLMRRRKREFGLYSILGMGKGSIAGILLWEGIFSAAFALLAGLLLGIGLSKLFELELLRLVAEAADFSFRVDWSGAGRTCLVYAGLFALLFLVGVGQTSLDSPIALLRSENVGEKPPRANYLVALAGLVLLAAAYYLAVTISDPVSAILVFFLAVAMVIVATYLLFIAGSVTLCRVLQRNPGYYYQPRHFVSVSSMAFRMKRNGAGLASICILLTMVLVTLSSTASLYIGGEDLLRSTYPRALQVQLKFSRETAMNDGTTDQLRRKAEGFCREQGIQPRQVLDYRTAAFSGMLRGGTLCVDEEDPAFGEDSQPVAVFLVPLEDYNRVYGLDTVLAEDEVLLYPYRLDYPADTFGIAGGETCQVKGVLDRFWNITASIVGFQPSLMVVTPNLDRVTAPLKGQVHSGSGTPMLTYRWNYGFDTDLAPEAEIALGEEFTAFAEALLSDGAAAADYVRVDCREENRWDFYSVYGGLFFLGLVLSAVFLAACVLILYYKQISEGYEDQGRFDTMRKVGMTRRDIRRSVNSQMLTVSFLPLLMAGIHMCFAFPLLQKLLHLFNLFNTPLLAAVTAACFALFGALYALVYRLTSRAYYRIVSPGRG